MNRLNRSRVTEPSGPTAIRTIHYFFSWNGSSCLIDRKDGQFGFQNLGWEKKIVQEKDVLQRRKKGNIWCYVCAMCIFFISIFIISTNMQIRTNKRTYLQ